MPSPTRPRISPVALRQTFVAVGCFTAVSCVRPGTAESEDPQQLEAERRHWQEERRKEDERARVEQEQRDLETAKAQVEADRQGKCKGDLRTLQEAKEAARKAQQALDACPNSGIPAGTYKTRSGSPDAELQVTDAGCAAYQAYAYHDGEHSRAYATSEGTTEVTYQRRYDCAVGGVLDADRKPAHSRWDGTGCRRVILDVLAEGTPWSVKGTTVTATANDSGGKRPIALVRVSADTSAWALGSPLWQKQRRESDSQARTSVAFAQPEPWQAPPWETTDTGTDWCAQLETEQAAGQ